MGRSLVAADEQTAKVASFTAARFAPKNWKPEAEAAEALPGRAASDTAQPRRLVRAEVRAWEAAASAFRFSYLVELEGFEPSTP